MNVFLTGGTGFIGSYVLRHLQQDGHHVLALRRPSSMPVIPLEQQPTWLEKQLSEVTNSDLSEIEVVLHLASAGVSPQQASWDELVRVNVAAGLELIRLSLQAGVRRFVAAGTCLEYGAEAEAWDRIPPQACLRPISSYAASKAAGFMLLDSFARENKVEFVYGRIFSAYGIGQYSGNLWPSLRAAAVAGQDFEMTTGEQVRDFLPVETVALHLLDSAVRPDVEAGKPLIINIGSGIGISVAEFAKHQWQLLGATGKLLLGATVSQPNQVQRLVADPISLRNTNKSTLP